MSRLLLRRLFPLERKCPVLGVSKLLHILTGHADFKEACPGRDKLYDLLRRNSLLLIRRVKPGPTTTNSRHHYMLYPNLIRELVVNRPDMLSVSWHNLFIYLCWFLLPEFNYGCLFTPDCRISCSSQLNHLRSSYRFKNGFKLIGY